MAKTNKKLVTIGVPLISFILAFEFLYVPWQSWVEEQKSVIERKSKVTEKQERAILNMPKYEKFIEGYKTDIAAVTTNFTTVEDDKELSIRWLSVIDDSASGYDLVVTNKIPRDKLIISDNLVAFSGNLKAEGSALVLLNFISKLEDINKGHRIKAVTFLRKPNSRNSLFVVDVEFIKVFSRA